MPKPNKENRSTTYGGIKVTANEMRMLKSQPISAFLSFKEEKDGRYHVDYQLPERCKASVRVGENKYEEKDVEIRKAINIIVKANAKKCIDKNGNISVEPYADMFKKMIDATQNSNGQQELLNYLGIDGKDRKTVETFFNAFPPNHVIQQSFWVNIANQNAALCKYSHLLDEYNRKADDNELYHNEELKNYLVDSYGDYQRMLQDMRDAANMDVDKEKGLLMYLDCGSFALLNKYMVELIDKKADKKVEFSNKSLVLASTDKNRDPKIRDKFANHAVFTGNAKISPDETKTISIERTAPPVGKLAFRPAAGYTGIGIFNSSKDLEAFHKNNNQTRIENIDFYSKINQKSDPLKGIQKLAQSDKVIEAEYNRKQYTLRSSKVTKEPEKSLDALALEIKNVKAGSTTADFNVIKELIEKRANTISVSEINKCNKEIRDKTIEFLTKNAPLTDKNKAFKQSSTDMNNILFSYKILKAASYEVNRNNELEKKAEAAIDGKKIVDNLNPDVVKKLSDIKENAEKAQGTFRDSKQYKEFMLMSDICTSLAKNIMEAKNAGSNQVHISMSKSDSQHFMNNVLRNEKLQENMSLEEAGVLLKSAYIKMQNSAREYIKYKMNDHTLDDKAEANKKPLNADDYLKLKVVCSALPKKEAAILTGLKVEKPEVKAQVQEEAPKLK